MYELFSVVRHGKIILDGSCYAYQQKKRLIFDYHPEHVSKLSYIQPLNTSRPDLYICKSISHRDCSATACFKSDKKIPFQVIKLLRYKCIHFVVYKLYKSHPPP